MLNQRKSLSFLNFWKHNLFPIFFFLWHEHVFSTILRGYMCSLMEPSQAFCVCLCRLYRISPFRTSRPVFHLTRSQTERCCFSKVLVEVEPFLKLEDYECDGVLDGMLGALTEWLWFSFEDYLRGLGFTTSHRLLHWCF